MYLPVLDDQRMAFTAHDMAATATPTGKSVSCIMTSRGLVIACIAKSRCGTRAIAQPLIVPVDDSTRIPREVDGPRASDDIPATHIIAVLSRLLVEAFKGGCTVSDAFVRHITLALLAINDSTAVDLASGSGSRGTLKTWQEKVAKDMLGNDPQGTVPLLKVARACGLSTSHFSRAFKRSIGMSPYRWSLLRRLDLSKRLLAESSLSLIEIACECGFCEQSHLNHAFSREFGISPGAWRKAHGAP